MALHVPKGQLQSMMKDGAKVSARCRFSRGVACACRSYRTTPVLHMLVTPV